MPTGYTSRVATDADMTIADFLLTCARNFGAFHHKRDGDSGELPARMIPTSLYHFDKLAEVEEAYAVSLNRSRNEVEAHRTEAVAGLRQRADEADKTYEAQRGNYHRMRHAVALWNPPTTEHDGLKRFMVEQLEQSILHDLDTRYPDSLRKKADGYEAETFSDYDARLILDAEQDVSYHKAEWQKEQERVASWQSYADALWQSVDEIRAKEAKTKQTDAQARIAG